MPLFLIAWYALFGVYIILLVYGWYRWKRLPSDGVPDVRHELFLTVIIPVRNEAENIIPLLNDLAAQDYSSELFEVIVVDDHSTDHTTDMVRQFITGRHSNMRLLLARDSNESLPSPKKNALAYGISHARGQCIVTTDGDCRVGPLWLASHAHKLRQNKIKLVAGPVFFYHEKKWLQKSQGLELAALIGTGAISLDSGAAGMANGANLSFWLSAFHKVGGYRGNEHVISGDDEFLLRKIHGQFPESVAFMKSRNAIVTTAPCADFIALFQQRRRWAGKWKLHRDIFSLLLPFFVFVFHLGWIATLGILLTHFAFIWLILSTFILKTAVEFLFLQAIRSFGEKKVSFPVLVLLQLLYPFYVVFFGIMANAGGFTWKGRTYSAHTHDRRRV